MKQYNSISLGDAIRDALKELNLNEGIYQSKIETNWATLMGGMIAKHTVSISLKKQNLSLTVDNPALKQELFYSREKIASILNEEFGQEVVKHVLIF